MAKVKTKAKAKKKPKNKKPQPDLPTLERPTNEYLDGLTADYREKAKVHGASTSALTASRAELDAGLLAEHEAGRIKETPKGEPVYVYHGEEKPLAVLKKKGKDELKVEPLTDKNDPDAVIG